MRSFLPDARQLAVAALLTACANGVAAPLAAQEAAPADRDAILTAIASWIALDVTPGREALAAPQLRALGFQPAPLDGYMIRRGKGSPRRVVACALDATGYAVSGITDDGFLRLHGSGNTRHAPLWDQFHEGQRIRVRTARGVVPGVIAVRSTHLWRGRTAETNPASLEDFYVDVGARSAAEVAAAGIALLDPVAREQDGWRYSDMVAGPGAAARAGCAAIAAASRLTPAHGETIYLLAAQGTFEFTGLSAALARIGAVDSLIVFDPVLARADSGQAGAQISRRAPDAEELALSPRLRVGAMVAIGVRTSFRGSLVESIAADDAAELFDEAARAAGVHANPKAVALPDGPRPTAPSADSLVSVRSLLTTLADSYGVSEHEAPVRNAVLRALPTVLRDRARVDSIGNIVLALGPARDTVMFVAHVDEIGFEITKIAPDGTLSLRTRGGFFRSLWEGQPALLHFDASHAPAAGCGLRFNSGDEPRSAAGVFIPRATATTKQPTELTAWLGVDSVALAACGVTGGMSLTGVKHAAPLIGTRFTARSIDDRAGCTALILAARALNEKALDHTVLFVWSVREETALGGAAAIAARLGPTIRRVHAVDTFVSADSPLESPRFAVAPIGAGAVVRALDNSSATPAREVEWVVTIAKANRIPLQVGTTNGGNDGSELARFGAVDVPISWPLRYSHSPAEVIDLRDVAALARLVGALAVAR